MTLKPFAPNDGPDKKIFLLKPRGFCAGVVRAIDVVKIALDLYGPAVLVRNEIVHNKDEVVGTLGESPEHSFLVETVEDVDRLELPDPTRVRYLTQTTLSLDETRDIISRLKERFPHIEGPPA